MRRPRRLPSLVVALAVALVAAASTVGPRDGGATRTSAASATGACGPHATYPTACAIATGTFDDQLAAPANVSFYRIAAPHAGEALRVRIDHSLGMQAALIRDATGSVGPVGGGLANTRPQYAVGEFGPALSNESTAGGAPATAIGPYPAPFESIPFESIPFESIPFESIPFESIPFESIPAEHADVRPIQLVALADGSTDSQTLVHFSDAIDGADTRLATLVLAIWAGSPTTTSYTVSVDALKPADLCAPGAVSLPALPDGFAPIGSVSPAVAATVSTLILTNEARWAQLYGADGDASVMQQLNALAASPLVNGAVLSVDTDPHIAAAYAAWDGDACSARRANAVAAAIKRLVSSWLTAYPSIRYIVVAGGDAVIPYFRIADDARIANEVQYAGQTGLNSNGADDASFLRRNLLTDDYYADPHGTLSGSRLLFGSQLATGRLVESPAEVAAEVQTFLSQNGVLNAASGLVTGYDFLQGTADAVTQLFTGHLSPLGTLGGPGWGAADVDAALTGDAGPDVVFFSGHFAHGAMQTAELDAYPAVSVANKPNLAGKLLFSIGCHSGASIVDAEADPTTGIATFDWAQAVAALGGVLVANTGYGYGDSDVPAYGQELMLDFAAKLAAGGGQPVSVGGALQAAKRLYLARNEGKWDGYHSKTLMESTLYGLPMYAITMPGASQQSGSVPELPITSARQSDGRYFSASQPGLFAYHAEIDVPDLVRHDAASGRGSYFASPDGVDIRAFQPVQPQLTFHLPRVPGFTVHGVAITGATYTESDGFDPIITRPMWDQVEYEPQFHYQSATPANPALVNAIANADGTADQYLVLTAGQFTSTVDVPAGDAADPRNPYVSAGIAYPHTTGRERLFRHFSLDVYYSDSTDWRGATLRRGTPICSAAGVPGVTVIAGNATRVTALVASGGRLTPVALTRSGDGWTAPSTATPGTADVMLTAMDAAGNVSILLLPSGTDVSAGCPMGQPGPIPGQPAATPGASPTPAPRPSIKITDVLTPTSVDLYNFALVPVRGTWDSGGSPCNQPGAQWTIVVVATGATIGTPPPVTLQAPCGLDGQAAPWQAIVGMPYVGGMVQVCAGIANSLLVTLTTTAAMDCRTLTLPSQPPGREPTTTPVPVPTVCNPRTQKC